MTEQYSPDLRVTIAAGRTGDPLVLANPVIAAAGTFGLGSELRGVVDASALGAIVTPHIARSGRTGRSPRFIEAPGGLLSALPYSAISLRRVERDGLPAWRMWRTPVLASLDGADPAACAAIAARLDDLDAVAGFELLPPDLDGFPRPEALAEVERLVHALLSVSPLPLLVKLPAASRRIVALARAAESAGADAITLHGTLPAAALDLGPGDDPFAGAPAVLSGPAVFAPTLRAARMLAPQLRIPLIAGGGIATWREAAAYLLAGATAVQVGSVTLANPRAAVDVVTGLARFLEARGLRALRELTAAGDLTPR